MPNTIPDASSIFLPCVRQGAAGAIQSVDNLSPTQLGRVSVPVKLRINDARDINVTVGLLGPGEVTGLDPQQIIRTDPKPSTATFEPNYLAVIEFDRPDLPWLFTPAKEGTDGKLRPWLCLVVVKTQSGVSLRSDRSTPLPILEIAAPAKPSEELPDLAESWAWAHAQLSAPQTASTADLAQILRSRPELSLSRLICPRVLQPDTSYLACLVPAFEVGRKAGLNLPVQLTETLLPAWVQAATQVALPVYYHWQFHTGAAGDFESLARLLTARPVPDEVGKRPMDVSTPGFPLPAVPAPLKILEIEGALRVPGSLQTPWPEASRKAFQQELRRILNQPAANPAVPLVAPPIYGAIYAGVAQVDNAVTPLAWVDELNLDPRERVVAGTGTYVVQSHQEELMASAWEQLGDLERANQRLRQEQLSLAVNTVLHVKHFMRFNEEALLQITAPAQARLAWADGSSDGAPAKMLSLARRIAHAVLPSEAVGSAARRLTSTRSAISRRSALVQADPGALQNSRSFIGKLNPRLGDRLVLRSSGAVTLNQISATIPELAQTVLSERATSRKVLNADDQAPAAPNFKIIREGDPMPPRVSRPFLDVDNAAAKNFRQAAAVHLERINRLPIREPAQPQLPLLEIKNSVLAQLNPVATVTLRVRATISRPPISASPGALRAPADPIRPIVASPEFPQPMYEVLRDLSQELLLPGLEKVPENTTTILETNSKFVEAFMVGLNTEMGRELVWRGFPTDQRGTYFRQFWDGIEPDLRPLNEWVSKPLGENLHQPQGGGLVLLIRGELLRRYPNAVIYAAESKKDPNGIPVAPRAPGPNEKYPIFRGTLQPDVTFIGFDLTETQATGDPANPNDGGWFFIIQEQPTEPRFGFDTDVNFGTSTHVTLTPTPPAGHALPAGAVWRKNSAHMALITRQQPVRIAIHATQMIR